MRDATKLVELKPAFNRLFKTPDGELAIQYLKTKFYDGKISNDNVLRDVGARDVVKHILTMMEK